MPTLSIKNVPDDVLSLLRDRAARHHRSVQGELMALLTAALHSSGGPVPAPVPGEQPSARRSGSRRIEEIAKEHRTRWKKPFSKGPLAVDLIREDRDAR
jgi:plasmid stability protein